MSGLWGEAYDISSAEKEKTKKIAKKAKTAKVIDPNSEEYIKKQLKSKSVAITEKLNIINDRVSKVLGHIVNDVLIVKSREQLTQYIDTAIKNGIIAIDTETNNSLEPTSSTCKIMGLCLYTPNEKYVYVPINHTDLNDVRLPWQLTENDCKEELQRLKDYHVKCIYHNAKFDYEVLKMKCNIQMPMYWDTFIASKLLNENEVSAGLKDLFVKYIDKNQEKYSIESLFETVPYQYINPEIFGLYSSHDSYMTHALYKLQKKQFENEDLKKMYNLFINVEMPCIEVVAEMELNGVTFDKEYAQRLKVKYDKKLVAVDKEIAEEIKKIQPQIDEWKLSKDANTRPEKEITKVEYDKAVGKSKKVNPLLVEEGGHYYKLGKSKIEQLDDPIKLSSPTQLAILFYDILKVSVVNPEKPRGTGEDELTAMKLPLSDLLNKRKGISKLLTAFIETLPQVVGEDGKIHTSFNQYGARTGRFSSSGNCNLQQIPSHNAEIRLLFTAGKGRTFCGGDYSQQEVKVLANYSQDKGMIDAYKSGKDFYSTVACSVYKNKYEDNLEHYPDGSKYEEGEKRRTSVKSILLGLMYGRGASAIAEQINSTREEAQRIIDDFYKGFPAVKKWMDNTKIEAKKTGYVEDWCGRRRHLPSIQLPRYTIIDTKHSTTEFNPFLGCKNREVINEKVERYKQLLSDYRNRRDVPVYINAARKEGIIITDNGDSIAHAEREAINARVQGGSASMTKVAMVKIYNDKILKDLDFKLTLQVHDELIGDCPIENGDKCAERVSYIMTNCVNDYFNVPLKCDCECETRWYLNKYSAKIIGEYKKYQKDITNEDEIINKMLVEHEELTKEKLLSILK